MYQLFIGIQRGNVCVTHIWLAAHRGVWTFSAQHRVHFSVSCISCLIFPAFQQRRCTETSKLTLKFLNGETNLVLSLRKKQIITALVTVSLFLTLRWLWPLPATLFQKLYFPRNDPMQHEDLRGDAEERCAIDFLRNVQFSSSTLVFPLLGGQPYLSLHLLHYPYLTVLIMKNEANSSHAMLKVVCFVSDGFQLLS